MTLVVEVERGTWCLMGWGPGGCTYTGGCYCERDEGHGGRHRCGCGRTKLRQPDDPRWDDEEVVADAGDRHDVLVPAGEC